MGLIFVGGVISGWPPAARLARPYLVEVDGRAVEPPGIATARWMRSYVGPNNRIATDQSNARLMLAYGEQAPLTGRIHGIQAMLTSTEIRRGEREILQGIDVRYVVVDERKVSWDNMIGLYFNRENHVRQGTELFERTIFTKFDEQEGVSKILDSGSIGIYDVEALSDATTVR
jgi:hypothetical protein